MACRDPRAWLAAQALCRTRFSHNEQTGHPCRRERDSAAVLKASLHRQRELDTRHSALATGLQTLQQLLARKGFGGSAARAAVGSMTGPGSCSSTQRRRPGSSSSSIDCAMAALSALLRRFSVDEGIPQGTHTAVVSPHSSESSTSGSTGRTVGCDNELPAVLPAGVIPGSTAEGASDPLDIGGLLPPDDSCGDAGCNVKVVGRREGGGGNLPADAPEHTLTDAAGALLLQYSSLPTEGTSPLAADRKPGSVPSRGRHGSSSSGFRQLMLRPCCRLSPRATVSSGCEVPAGQRRVSAAGLHGRSR